MMKKLTALILLLASVYLLNAQISHHGYVRTYLGTRTEQAGEYSIMQNTFNWKLDYGKGNSALLINPILEYNALDHSFQTSLRQAYIDLYFDNFDLRIGKQQIVWGKSDGVFITDVISPRDLSEFILPDFEEIRIGINAVKLDYYLGSSSFEVVWIPTFQPTILPAENSLWAVSPPNLSGAVNLDESKAEVANKLENSEVAFKYSFLGSYLDFELMTAYMWDDNPALHLFPQTDSSLTIRPEHHRLPLVGASFSKSAFGAVWRGEAAYYFQKNFASELIAQQAIAEKDYAHYLLGYDHNWFGINLSLQIVQEYIVNYSEDLKNDEFQTTSTWLLAKNYLNEMLELSLFGYYGINAEDALLRPKVSYDLADGLNILLGADIFLGEQGTFGQFADQDLVYLKMKYYF